jgi:diguanylate cyclase
MPSLRRPRTRSSDSALKSGLRLLVDGGDGRADAVLLGRVLLVATALIVALTVPLLDPDTDALFQVTEVVLGAGLAIAISYAFPWQRHSPRLTLAFPVVVAGLLICLASRDAAAFAPLTGLLTLAFAFIGLTQPSRTSLAAVPVAAAVLIYMNGQWSAAVATRAALACVVWTLLGELLSYFGARQVTLSTALRAAAHTDALTGLANRRDLDLRLAAAVAGDAVVVCDLDHFKQLNDSRGHRVGDLVLAEFGSMLRSTLRSADYCARFGGEEFVLLLPATSALEAEATVARVRAHWGLLQPDVTFSAGVALLSADRGCAATLGAADQAMYAAKQGGRNCTRVAALRSQPGQPARTAEL